MVHTKIIQRCIRVKYVSKLEPAAHLMCIIAMVNVLRVWPTRDKFC